jgi:protein gp37
MAENSKIEWTDHTWSPWEGCTKVSPGCDHCYAEGMNRWLRKGQNWGPGAPRRTYSDEHWLKPVRWNEKAAKEGTRPKVFPSVCDPFDNEVDEVLRGDFLWLVEHTPNLTWLVLTKRIGNAARMLADLSYAEPLPNLWIGATVVNQEEADRDVPKLLATPARVRFLSMEPLLGPVHLTHLRVNGVVTVDALRGWAAGIGHPRPLNVDLLTGHVDHRTPPAGPRLDWVIVGGESGPGARPMHPDWARSLRDQCAAAGVPLLFKQWGEWAHDTMPGVDMQGTARSAVHRWGNLDYSIRIGKKAAGRLLDGVTHDGFPAGDTRGRG